MAHVDRGSIVDSLGQLFDAGTVTGLSERELLERFLARGDDAAFAAILTRHGPMVLGVCRRILHDADDVADAFQATFLILVKKGRSIRQREALGTWLYGVARRVAVRARVQARRRNAREHSGIAMEEQVVDAASQRSQAQQLEATELRSMIDDELERLPARYRAPLILCDLEGQTHEQAAAQLGCPVGTVKSRLSRGREHLRSRLVRRGVSPSAALMAAQRAAESGLTVPPELMNPTLAAAKQIAAGSAVVAGISSVRSVSLMKGVLRSMMITRLSIAAAALTAVALASAGLRPFVASSPARLEPGAPQAAKEQAAGPQAADPAPAERSVERFRLANGLRVILRPIKGSKETALVVVYDIGSDHDPEGRSGLAHAVEHVYLTAAAGDRKARTNDELHQQYPNWANAQTGDRYTVISTVFPPGRLDGEIEEAALRMGGLHVAPADLDRERPRLLAEVQNMFEGFPTLAALNNARELVRPMPRGGRHGGRPEHLRAITWQEIQARLDAYYKPANATLAIAGDFDPAAVRRSIENGQFARLPKGEGLPAAGEPGSPRYFMPTRPKAGAEEAEGDPTACLAYPAPQPGSPSYPAFLILIMRLWAGADRLGGSGATGSPVYFTPLDDGSVVAVTVTLKPGEPPVKAFGRIEKFVADTIAPPLAATEAAQVKEQLALFLGTADIPDDLLGNNPYGVAFSLARRAQLGMDSARLSKALDAVTDAELKRVAALVFAPSRHAGALAGQVAAGR